MKPLSKSAQMLAAIGLAASLMPVTALPRNFRKPAGRPGIKKYRVKRKVRVHMQKVSRKINRQ